MHKKKCIEVYTDKNTFLWEELGKPPKMKFIKSTGNSECDYESFKYNTNVIRDETEHFINSVKNNRQTCYPFHQALNDLKIILDMRNIFKN